jgi:hypothetical protein
MKLVKSMSIVFFAVLSALALPSFAAEADYTALTAGVVVTNLIAALFAVALVMVGLYLARKGIYLVLGMLQSKS